MFWKKPEDKKVKTLSEREIQERLYGFSYQSEMVGDAKPAPPEEAIIPNTKEEPVSHTEILSVEKPKIEDVKQTDLFGPETQAEGDIETLVDESTPEESHPEEPVYQEEIIEEKPQVEEPVAEEPILEEPREEQVIEEETQQEEPRLEIKTETAEPEEKNAPKIDAGATTGGMELPGITATPKRFASAEIIWQRIEDFINTCVNTCTKFIKKSPVFYITGAAILGMLIIAIIVGYQFLGSEGEGNPPAVQKPVIEVSKAEETPAQPSRPARTTTINRAAIPPAVPPSAPPQAVPPAKTYSVQLCLSDDMAASEKVIEGLKAKGYDGYIRNIRGSRGNQLYQIFVGRYASSSDAQKALKELRQDPEFKIYDDSFVRTSK